MNWIKKNYKIILLVSIPVLIALDILIRVFFGFHLVFDSNNFNNIITPIGTIISAILFFYALTLTIKQNKIILSQSLKPHFEEKFKRLETTSEMLNRLPFHANRPPVKSKDMVREILQVWTLMLQDDDFQNDLRTHYDGHKLTANYVGSRSYADHARYLNTYTIEPLWDMAAIEGFIIDINNSNLVPDDKMYLKKRVKEVLVSDYISLIESFEDDESMYLIPNLRYGNPNVEIEFILLLRNKRFRKHYEFFKKEL